MADNETEEATEQAPAGETAQENGAEDGEKAAGDDEEEVKFEGEVKDEDGGKDNGEVKKIKVTFHIPSATTTHLKPSLPSILTEYGMADTTSPRVPEKKKEKKVKKKRRSFADDKDSDAERQKDERYLGVMDRLEKVRSDLYDEYMDLLIERVEKQRKQIRQRSQKMERKIAEQEERERQESHRVKKRFPKKTLETDKVYLETIPKSDYYRILDLQDKLVRCGRLKNQYDLDKFWKDLLQPDVFYAHFKVPRFASEFYRDDSTAQPLPPDKMYTVAPTKKQGSVQHKSPRISVNEEDQPSEPATRELASITEDADNPVTPRDTWAITHGPPVRFAEPGQASRTKGKGKKPGGLKKHTDDFEIRFPKVELPPLHCFNMDLTEKPPDPEEVRRQIELRNMQIGRKIYLRKLHKMHQLAMANNAAATRIIEKRKGEFGFFPEPSLGDLLSLDTLLHREEPQKKKPIAAPARICIKASTFSTETEYTAEDTEEEEEEPLPPEQEEVDETPPMTGPLPLTLQETLGNCKIIEAKCLSTLWTNYMGVGLKPKSVES